MTADPRIQERLRRAADPLSIDVEARLEGARHRVADRQRNKRIGAGMLAAVIGAAAAAAIWSLGEGQGRQPAGPTPAGTILHVVTGREWLDSQLFALPVGDEPPGAVVPWPGETTPLAAPSYTPDGSQVAFLIDTGERTELGPLFDIAVQRGEGPVEILVRDVDIVAEPEMGPQGQVAFVRRAGRDDELVIVAPDGTVGDPVVTGLAMNALAWSPDGSTIAINGAVRMPDGSFAGQPFVLMSPDGTDVRNVRLGLDQYPARGFVTWDWSADGSTLAWTSYGDDGTSDIYLMDADGSNVRIVTPEGSPADTSARYPIWAPEGDRLAFVSDRDADPAVRTANAERDVQRGFGLYVMRSDGSEVQPLIAPAEEGPMMVDWLPAETGSPTSAPPAVAAPAGFILWGTKGVDAPGGGALPPVHVQPADASTGPVEVADPPILISPDGTQILWAEPGLTLGVDKLVVGAPDRSSSRVVAAFDLMNERWMAWSPDGRFIALTVSGDVTEESAGLGPGLWVSDTRTGSTREIPGWTAAYGVDWAPDSGRLAIGVTSDGAVDGSAEPGVYVMNADGTDVTRISPRDTLEVAWSPDGDTILFWSRAPGDESGYGVWAVTPDGTDERFLFGGTYPMWSPDGEWILYVAEDPEATGEDPQALWIARPDGSDARIVVPDPGDGWPIPWAWVEDWPL